ncbi:MAG: MliC family protein [Phenylobacterium sp.]
MTGLRAAAIVLAVGLSACSRPQRQAHVEGPPPAPPTAAGPVNPDPKVSTYACEDGETVQAGYPDADTAVLDYKGHTYTLKIARSASGARYIGYGLQWWTKGMEEAAFANLKPGEEIASAPGIKCVTRPVTPTGPATPVPETAFPPESPQAAALVAQTYYELLGQGNHADAARLRSDGQVGDFSSYDTLKAQVGAPGVIEGAAGSLYVEVPVTVQGRLKTGAELRQVGKVVLRRVNDVPGSTAQQRSWRIDRIDLKP